MSKQIETLTMKEVCARYKCTPKTVYKRIKHNGFPTPAHFGRAGFFNVATLDDWERKHPEFIPAAYFSDGLLRYEPGVTDKTFDEWHAEVQAQKRKEAEDERERLKIESRDKALAKELEQRERIKDLLVPIAPKIDTAKLNGKRRRK